MLTYDSFKSLYVMFYYRKRLRPPRKKKYRVLDKVNMFVETTTGFEKKGGVFLGTSITLLIGGSIAGWKAVGLFYGVLLGIAFSVTPALVLKIKLEAIRNRGSREGETFLAELISRYRMSSYNMNSCLEMLTQSEKTGSVCYKQCQEVLSRARESSRSRELYRCADGFSYAIGTNWSRMLAYNIGQSICFGYNVMSGMEDILSQLREARQQEEERKRMNSESARLVLFMVPFTYAITVYFTISWLGLGVGKLVKNQFCTSAGISFLLAIAFLFLINLVLISMVRNRRFDY